ncbi:uncharacterized protein LOC117788683 [Drosophila innubila]|uniref:uncharacterized protein LOC117788683 n=1 Tax=Drosophila innubila TaxID=198719 RepID=UPI00148E64D6|nr:uncharacterized protein LOC117788683 [Drosophila innubila]
MFFPRSSILNVARYHESSFVLTFFVGMLFFVVFLLSDQVRHMNCLNWIIALVIVECEIVSIALLAVGTSFVYLIISLIVALFMMIFGMLLGFLMTYDLTRNIHFMFTVTFCAFVLSIYVAVFLAILQLTWPFFVYAAVIALMVLPVLVYHMQYILGNGTVRASLKDDKLAALLLFTDFLALFMLTFYWRPTRGDKQ